jgi:hypothetical protein
MFCRFFYFISSIPWGEIFFLLFYLLPELRQASFLVCPFEQWIYFLLIYWGYSPVLRRGFLLRFSLPRARPGLYLLSCTLHADTRELSEKHGGSRHWGNYIESGWVQKQTSLALTFARKWKFPLLTSQPSQNWEIALVLSWPCYIITKYLQNQACYKK